MKTVSPSSRGISGSAPHGACSAARTRSQKGLSEFCEMREPRSSPAKRRQRMCKAYINNKLSLTQRRRGEAMPPPRGNHEILARGDRVRREAPERVGRVG